MMGMERDGSRQQKYDDPQQRIEELQRVNSKYEELVQILIDRIEGEEEEEYAYSFEEGWKQKREDSNKDELDAEDLDAQLREIKQRIQQYSE